MKERFLIFGLLFVALPAYAAVNTLQGDDDGWGKLLDAGADQTITLPSTADLEGIVLSAGFSEGLGSDLGWVQLRGPGKVSFGDPSSPNTTATFPVPGRYVLRFWASGADETVSDDVSVKVKAAPVTNHAVVVNDATITNEAVVVYVATNGSDVNPGTKELPYRTIGKGLESVGAGDTVVIRGGRYGRIDSSSTNIPSGTSWDEAVTVRAYDSEEVTIEGGIQINDGERFVILRALIVDMANSPGAHGVRIAEPSTHHIRIDTVEVRNVFGASGIITANGSGFNQFIDCEVHGVSFSSPTNQYHGIYLTTSDNHIDGGEYHDNLYGYGVHLHDSDPVVNRNVVRNVRSHANLNGMVLGGGEGNIAYNNLIYDNLEISVDIGWSAWTKDTGFYNNTIYAPLDSGYALHVVPGSSDTDIRNNIFRVSSPDPVWDEGVATVLVSNLAGNPSFVDEEARNFRLSPGSPAIDTGTPVAEAVPVDIDGVARPVGAGFDIGAHEYR